MEAEELKSGDLGLWGDLEVIKRGLCPYFRPSFLPRSSVARHGETRLRLVGHGCMLLYHLARHSFA